MVYSDARSGNLRLTVMSQIPKNGLPIPTPTKVFSSLADKFGAKITKLSEGRYLGTCEKSYVEDGESIYQQFWIVEVKHGKAISAAIFSYAILQHLKDDPFQRETIQMIDREVRSLKVRQG